jgi:uncharacterized membrane protein
VLIALGGFLTVMTLRIIDPDTSINLQTRSWVMFWSTVTTTGVTTSGFAAIAGAIVISGQRSVLTTGVMVALALVPSMTLVGMGVAVADYSLAWGGAVRWMVDAGLVLSLSALVILVKKWYLQRHPAIS